jgi:hypothetical protein
MNRRENIAPFPSFRRSELRKMEELKAWEKSRKRLKH